MMIRVVVLDNTEDAEDARFTPLLIECVAELARVTVVRTRAQALRAIATCRPHGILLSGSHHTLSEKVPKDLLAANAALVHSGLPVLGICFGMQVMALLHGGHVQRLPRRITGVHSVHTRDSVLFDDGVAKTYHDHRDAVVHLPHGFVETARWQHHGSRRTIPMAMEHCTKPLYGVQFHPEVDRWFVRSVVCRFLSACCAA